MSVPDAEPESCFVDTNIWLYAFEAAVLYSEDMQDGLVVENRVRIINLFKQRPPTGAQPQSSA